MENIDDTNIKETLDAWGKEFLESEQAASLTSFQREHFTSMVDPLITVATHDKHPIPYWTPILVEDMVVNGVCKIYPLKPEVLAVYSTTMDVFFNFLAAKDYLSNGKEIGAALIAAKANIKQSEAEIQKLEVLQMLLEEAKEEGIGLSDTDELLAFMDKRAKEQEIINTFHDKSDAGIPIDQIMADMTTKEQDIVIKSMSKQLQSTEFDPVKGKKGMKMVELAMARGKSIEEATAALPEDLMQHVLGYMQSIPGLQGGGGYVEPVQPIRKEAKIGRNDPCSCGSGKKYKRCCLRKK